MKSVLRVLVLAILVVVQAAVCVLAEDDSLRLEEQLRGRGVNAGDAALQGQRDQSGQVNQAVQSLPGSRTSEKLPNLFADEQKKLDDRKTVQKTRLLLKAEEGDGLVALRWVISGLPKNVDPAVRYVVEVGLESGKYSKKIDVGTTTAYRLRELKNNEAYFIRVSGAGRIIDDGSDGDKAKDFAVVSNEVVATPIPAELQGSLLERSFSTQVSTLQDKIEAAAFKRELKQFGYEFFRNSRGAGVVADTVPVSADYVIGPGDSLRIELSGNLQGRHEVTVDRNGEIYIAKVGNVKVWGLSYAQAKEAINKAISRYFKGYELNVTLGHLRSIQVFVVGEVEVPGSYAISSVGTVINALFLAGGPSKNGSLRRITLSRSGKQAQEIDLYEMFLSGDRSKDVRLESGDTIFVPVVGAVAAVAGEVRRPGIYELKGATTIPQLLAMAGGVAASGDNGRIQVERIEGNSARTVLDYEPKGSRIDDALATVSVSDMDMVKVFPVHRAYRKVITLQGNVTRPGEYQFRPGMRVKDIIPSFNSLLPDSYLDSAEIVRLVQPDLHREPVSFNLKKAIEGDEGENVLLHEQDTIRVFSRGDMGERPVVSINGLVVNPGTYDFYPRMTVRDLVNAAGNIKRSAYLDNAELTRISIVNGVARIDRKDFNLGKALAGDPAHNFVLQEDDTVIVRSLVEWTESVDRFVTIKGEVKFPGVYSITKGEKLSSVIARAGGYTDKVYFKGAKFIRKSVRENQQKRMDEVIVRTEQEILQKQGELASLAASREELDATRAALDGLLKGLEKLKTAKAQGRVVIRLAQLDELKRSSYDLEMLGGDELEIPPTPSVVNVMGHVYNPTSFVFMPGSNVATYLKSAGGPTRDSEEDDMYIIKADGSVNSRQNSSFGLTWDDSSRSWNFGSFMSRGLDPGDTLVVPQKIERIAWLREIKDITTIVSQIALTAATVFIGLK